MYQAFLSYSRADNRVADELHKLLDGYRTPKSLLREYNYVPPKLYPIFRDRTDLSGGGGLTDRVFKALKESKRLIVLCSPAASKSVWVEKEVKEFIRIGRISHIFPVIASNAPDAENVETEFFPPSLRGHGLLAADLREIRNDNGKIVGDGFHNGKLKLIAGLLNVPVDSLVQRERKRQR